MLGLLGPNGAGKTTTMRLLTGFLRPDRGQIRVGGHDPAVDRRACGRLLGYVPEASAVYPDMGVRAYLRHWARLRGVPRRERDGAVAKALRATNLGDVADHRIGTLSRGFRQRVVLAQALVHDPTVLVLDEPTVGLDPRQVVETRTLIERLGRTRTILFSSHLLPEVSQLCRRVVVLDRGRVVAVDEVAALTAKGGRTRLELRVTATPDAAAAACRAVPGVEKAEVRGSVVVVSGTGTDLAAATSAAVVGAGIGLLELRTASAGSLEEAYLDLVRRDR